MSRTSATLAAVLVVLTLVAGPASASTSATRDGQPAAAAPSPGDPLEIGPSKQQQSAWLDSLMLSFLAMIGAICLASAWAAWAYHRSLAASIRCGALTRRPSRVPAPVSVATPARTPAQPARRPVAVVPQPVGVGLEDLFTLAGGRRPAASALGVRMVAWAGRVEAPVAEKVARLGGRLARWATTGASGGRRVLRWNGLAFVALPEAAHRQRRAASSGEALRLAS